MPYPNEHSARIRDPDKYKRIRRVNDKFGPGIDAIFGVTEDDKSEVQAIRFDRKKFTVEEAKKWLADHDYKPIEFEPATGAVEKMAGRVTKIKLSDVTEETLKKLKGGELFLMHRALHAMKLAEAVAIAHGLVVRELKRRGMRHLTPLKLDDVELSQKRRDLVLVPDYVSIVGDAARGTWEDARDFDVLVRDDIDRPKYWNEDVFALVKSLLDPGGTDKNLRLLFDSRDSRSGTCVPILDLVLSESTGEVRLVKAAGLRLTLMGVGATKTLRHKPAGLLVEHAGKRVMIDGSKGNPPRGSLDAWLVTDARGALVPEIRKLAEERGVEAVVGIFYADSTTVEPRLVQGSSDDSYGYLITTDKRKIAWAPSFKEFPEWADGADLMFAEAANWGRATKVAEQAKGHGVKRLVFAHIGRSTVQALDSGEMVSFGEFGQDGDTFLMRSTSLVRTARRLQKSTVELKVAVLEVAKDDDGYAYLCGLRVPEGSELAALEELDGKPVFPLGTTIAHETKLLAETGDTLVIEIMGLTLHEDGTVAWSEPIPLRPDKGHPHTLEQAIALARDAGVLTEQTPEPVTKGVPVGAPWMDDMILDRVDLYEKYIERGDAPEEAYGLLLTGEDLAAPEWFGTRHDEMGYFLLDLERRGLPIPDVRFDRHWTAAALLDVWQESLRDLSESLEDFSKAMPRRDKCMRCSAAPIVEVLWAEACARAWFCDRCFKDWEKDNGDDINMKRRITDGAASKGWPTRKAASVLAKTIRHKGDGWAIYDRTGKKKLGEFDTEEEAEVHLREMGALSRVAKADPRRASKRRIQKLFEDIFEMELKKTLDALDEDDLK